MFIRPFDTIIWNIHTSFQTLIVEDSEGSLYRYSTVQPGIHITEVEDWVKIKSYAAWEYYLEVVFGGGSGYPESVRKAMDEVSEKIRLHLNPPAPERSQGDIIFEIIDTLLQEAIDAREDNPAAINGYAVGYDDGRIAGLRTALRSVKDFMD